VNKVRLNILAVVLGLILVACVPSPTPTASPVPTVLPAITESVVDKILRGEPLVAGVRADAPPWGFLDKKGVHIGFDVELVQAMAQRWGMEVEFVAVTAADRLERLAAGDVDLVAASMTHRRDREEFADFSITYFMDGQALLVAQKSGLRSLIDLNGKVAAAARGTTSIENLRAKVDELGIRVAIVEVDDHAAGLQELVVGTVDAYTTDASILAGLAKQQPGLVVVGGPFSFEPYGLGVPQNDSTFRDLVNFTLQDLYLDGTYAVLYQKWLLGGDPRGINVGGEVFQLEVWPAGEVANYILGE
jgi:polar amino acid transport system substrate-binding protein